MLARRLPTSSAFTRRDAARLGVAAAILVGVMTAMLSVDILPSGFSARVGDVAPTDIRAPRTDTFTSQVETEAAREEARKAVPPQYDWSPERGQLTAARQVAAFDRAMQPVDAAFAAVLDEKARAKALAGALPGLSTASLETLQGLSTREWRDLRAEMERALEAAQRVEVRDTLLPAAREALGERLSPELAPAQRALAVEILGPYLVANSTYDAAKHAQAREEAALAVPPVSYTIKLGELIVQSGRRLEAVDIEKMAFFGLLDPQPDGVKLIGWLLLSTLTVGLLLAWVWRFRPMFWHRNNALLLVGFLLVMATLALKATGDRSVLPFFMPIATAGLLISILLDAGAAVIVLAVLGVLASVITGAVELGVFVLMGGTAGIVALRRGERLGNFIQAGAVMAAVNLVVVIIFGLLGEHDLTWVLQLSAASVAAAVGSAVAAVGTFALLGNVFGITTSFQLLELANPSQALLRRLLLETPGTYHHSLMVGNLSERAAEAIGADPLLARVAAYYHDIGKLANPLAFIENQAGMENVHDELTPEQSAQVLKAHVANGIDLAYQYRLPKAIIAFIPQHHGTALMSFFYARAKEQAVEAAGARPGTPEAAAAEAAVDAGRYRHSGPKPQTKEAAILMLADGVEAAVRSLTSQEEPAIRAMVERIFRERLEDGQFDECDLTLRDLERVREAFVAQLLGMYHRRIEYPQNKIVELESRRAAAGGGGPAG
ncbi:MAG TPA: HDIG domain-containing protein [Candidatus Limnocylindrales bacterium]|nr:HDIG domain-containing protein [Candidatus Limnocylindrales bacterium]